MLRPPHHTFPRDVLHRRDLDLDPLVQVRVWLGEAVRAGSADPYAMTLATVCRDGTPAARTVTLKDVDERGLLFTSRTDGAKARQGFSVVGLHFVADAMVPPPPGAEPPLGRSERGRPTG